VGSKTVLVAPLPVIRAAEVVPDGVGGLIGGPLDLIRHAVGGEPGDAGAKDDGGGLELVG